MEWLRKILLAMTISGALVSGLALIFVIAGPDQLEVTIKAEVVPRVEAKIRALVTIEPTEREGRTAAIRNKVAEKAREAVERMLGSDFADRVRTQIDSLCVCRMSDAEQQLAIDRYDEARATLKAKLESALKGQFSALKLEKGTVAALVDGYYVETVKGLARELRIFFALNLVLFLLVAAFVLSGRPDTRLILPAGMLFAATIWTGYMFLFERNWLARIVFHDWTGYGYLLLVSINFAILILLAVPMMRRDPASVPTEA